MKGKVDERNKNSSFTIFERVPQLFHRCSMVLHPTSQLATSLPLGVLVSNPNLFDT